MHGKSGKLIVIEGTDGSGKATQANILYNALTNKGYPTHKVSFPRYGHPMCIPVEEFLAGHLGPTSNVSPYGASLLYAVDQWSSYETDDWGDGYRNGEIVVADRYATSNMLHQGSRLDEPERSDYLAWLKNLQFNKLCTPAPDIVIYLHVDPDIGEKILAERTGKEGVQHDILESDKAYQRRCKEIALEIAQKEHWHVINCTDSNGMRPILEIHDDIMLKIQNILPKTEDNTNERI